MHEFRSNVSFRILAVNPGSTSTKIAVFLNEVPEFSCSINHSTESLKPFPRVADQFAFRVEIIRKTLTEQGIDSGSIQAVVGRGGLLRPISGGTYQVNQRMLEDLHRAERGEHASNLGAIIAHHLASLWKLPAFIVDPVVVDELDPESRPTGIPGIERLSIFHALNQRAVARMAARELGKSYDEARLVVAHLGGGISVGAHRYGRVVDVNNALDGEGPFSPERAGTLPAGQFAELCFSGRFTLDEIKKRLTGAGGLVAHFGTNDLRSLKELMNSGDGTAKLYYETMAGRVAKEIGAMAAVLDGRVDAVVLTGGLAHDQTWTGLIQKRVEWIAPVKVFPGEEEMRSLALGVLRVLKGEEEAGIY